jgi:excisionase family DNA binding protein
LDQVERVPAPAFEPRFGRSVSLDQAAVLLRISRRTVYNWIRAGRLRTIRTIGGKSQRVLLASLHEVAERQADAASPVRPSSSAACELS